ncbi:unnamed protein product, partial [Ectocarpus sp. 12 AP-2014]
LCANIFVGENVTSVCHLVELNVMLYYIYYTKVVTDDSLRFSGTDHAYVDPQYQQPVTDASE